MVNGQSVTLISEIENLKTDALHTYPAPDGHTILVADAVQTVFIADSIGIDKYLNQRAEELSGKFQFIRKAFYDSVTRETVLAALCTKRGKIKLLLENHYGPFNYSCFESAFDEYCTSMLKKYGIHLREDLILLHAHAKSDDEIKARGYMNQMMYVNDMVSHEEREIMIIKSGGFSYAEWLEKELEYFTTSPFKLFTELKLVFENLFPGTVTLDRKDFCRRLTALDINIRARILFEPPVQFKKPEKLPGVHYLTHMEGYMSLPANA